MEQFEKTQPSARRREVSSQTPAVEIQLFMNENTMIGLGGPGTPESTEPVINGSLVVDKLLENLGQQLHLSYLLKEGLRFQIKFSDQVQSPTFLAKRTVEGLSGKAVVWQQLHNSGEVVQASSGKLPPPPNTHKWEVFPGIEFTFPEIYRQYFRTENVLDDQRAQGLFKNILMSLAPYANTSDIAGVKDIIMKTKLTVKLVPHPSKVSVSKN